MKLSSESKKLAALLIVAIYNCLFLPKLNIALQVDDWIHDFFINHHSPVLDIIMNAFSLVGGSYGFVVFLLVYAGIYFWRSGIQHYRNVLLSVGIFSLLKLGNYWLKLLFARARPETAIGIIDTYSMPSGHAANAALMFGAIMIVSLKLKVKPLYQYLINFISVTFIIGIATSRLYLGVHYLSDVIMGALWTATALALLAISYPEIFMLQDKR